MGESIILDDAAAAKKRDLHKGHALSGSKIDLL